jgi:competence protein ComEC
MLEADRRRLFLWLPAFYASGIVLYFMAESEPSWLASALPLGVTVALGWRGRARFGVLLIALAMSAALAGFLAATLRTLRIAAPVLRAPVSTTVTGFVESTERTSYGGRIILAVEHFEPALDQQPERVRLTFRGSGPPLSGDRVRLQARLTPPGAPSVPSGFDFQREAFFQRLGAVGTVSGPISLVKEEGPPSFRIRVIASIDAARNALTERIIAVIGGSTGAIAAALVTGKRGQIAESDNENWRGAGIYHIISISGLHMALAAGLFFWTARLLLAALPGFPHRHAAKKWAAVTAMIGTVAYDVFSGHEVATERSMIMTLVMLGAILFDRPALAMRNLAISGMIVMTLRPETVLGPSFQMSFGAVAGLVAYGEFMRRWREQRAIANSARDDRASVRMARLALDFAATSLIAGLATAPFQAFHFHRLNPYGLLGNAIAVPLCSAFVMPAALAGVVLYPFGLDAPAWLAMGYGIATISSVAEQVASLAGAIATVPRFSTAALVVMAIAMAGMTLMTTQIFHACAAAMALMGVLMAARSPRPVLILAPDGRHALVASSDGLILLGRGRPTFSLQQWLPGEGDGRNPRDPSISALAQCDPLGCTARLIDGRSIALVLERTAFAEDCERAAVIVTPLRAPPSCTTTARVFDQNHFRNFGATYLYASQSPADFKAEYARNPRQKRPWIPGPTTVTIPNNDGGEPASSAREALPPVWDPQAPDTGNSQ